MNKEELELERTELSEERTFLSYVRTTLAVLGIGIATIKLFVDIKTWANIALVFLILIAAVVIAEEYHLMKKREAKIEKKFSKS